MSALDLSHRRVAKNAVSQTGVYALTNVTRAVALFVVARAFGPDGLGVFSPLWSLTGILSLFAVLGLDYWLVRELSRSRSMDKLFVAFPLGCVLGMAVAVLFAGVPMVVGSSPEMARALLAGAAYIAASGPVLILRAALHAKERMELETLTVGVEGVVGLVALAGVVALHAGVPYAIGALALGRGANLVATVIAYRRVCGPPAIRFEPRRWPAMVRASLPMGLSYACTTLLLRFDIVLLGAMRPPREVGIYSAAAVLALTVPLLAAALSRALYPVMARALGIDDPELRDVFQRTWRVLIAVGLAAGAGIAVLAQPIIGFVFGASFAAAAPAAAVLAVVIPMRFTNVLLGVVLNATDHAGRRTAAAGTGVVINLALNLVMIPTFGWWGAVWATIATEVLLGALLLSGIRPLRPDLGSPLLEAFAGAAAAAGVAWVTPGHLIVRAFAGGAAFASLAAVRVSIARGRAGSRSGTGPVRPLSGREEALEEQIVGERVVT